MSKYVFYSVYNDRLSNLCSIVQNNMVQLLETALVDGISKVPEALQPSSVNSLFDMLPVVTSNSGDIEIDDRIKCSLQGIYSSVIPLFWLMVFDWKILFFMFNFLLPLC